METREAPEDGGREQRPNPEVSKTLYGIFPGMADVELQWECSAVIEDCLSQGLEPAVSFRSATCLCCQARSDTAGSRDSACTRGDLTTLHPHYKPGTTMTDWSWTGVSACSSMAGC